MNSLEGNKVSKQHFGQHHFMFTSYFQQMSGLNLRQLRSELAGPFDLNAAQGQILAVMGPSGSGKSLFLRMIADLDPHTGDVTLRGRSRADMPAPEWRARSPYVAAESGWWHDVAGDHFEAALRPAAEALGSRVGLGARHFESTVATLSTGERQRLALIRALVLEPPLLLLDEPTGPLDPDASIAVETLLRERAASGGIVILATHDLAQCARLNGQALHMTNRRFEVLR